MAAARLALVPYVADTEVVDPESLTMHVQIIDDDDGIPTWHRPLAGTCETETACGDPIDSRWVLAHRVEKLEGKMCERGCFSDRELVKAALANSAARRRTT